MCLAFWESHPTRPAGSPFYRHLTMPPHCLDGLSLATRPSIIVLWTRLKRPLLVVCIMLPCTNMCAYLAHVRTSFDRFACLYLPPSMVGASHYIRCVYINNGRTLSTYDVCWCRTDLSLASVPIWWRSVYRWPNSPIDLCICTMIPTAKRGV